MDNNKLKEIVDEENLRLEREAVCEARSLIQNIAQARQSIRCHEDNIAEYQKRLKALQVEQLDVASILGA